MSQWLGFIHMTASSPQPHVQEMESSGCCDWGQLTHVRTYGVYWLGLNILRKWSLFWLSDLYISHYHIRPHHCASYHIPQSHTHTQTTHHTHITTCTFCIPSFRCVVKWLCFQEILLLINTFVACDILYIYSVYSILRFKDCDLGKNLQSAIFRLSH